MFDAHPGPALPGRPGDVLRRSQGAVLVRTGDGLWIGGRVAKLRTGTSRSCRPPWPWATGSAQVPVAPIAPRLPGDQLPAIGPVGVLSFDFYNGAMSTGQCERLAAALRHATTQDTRVLVLRGGEAFSNGIHLNVIEAAPSPASRRGTTSRRSTTSAARSSAAPTSWW